MTRLLTFALLLLTIAGCNDPNPAPTDTGPGHDTGIPVDTGTPPVDTGAPPVDAFVGSDGGSGCELTTYPTLAFEELPGSFSHPLAVVQIPGSSDLAVVEHGGTIQRMHRDGSNGGEFIDIGSVTGGATNSEQGLLGLAFHPDYAANGLFYVAYTPVSGTDPSENVVAVGHRSTSDPDVADGNVTPIVTLTNDIYSNHNGGNLAFGPDGNLYIGTGDGGSGGDPQHHGQDTNTLYAKILRVHVGPGIATYETPSTNPFASGGGLPEIYAYGLRNPWRFSFDRWSGALYIGDVGQDTWEEIDVDTDGMGGDNYGWNTCEATHDFGGNDCSALAGHHAPIFEYSHSGSFFDTDMNASITGGVVYRGAAIPGLYGTYLFADEVTSQFGGMRYCAGAARDPHVFGELGACSSPASFGEDTDGNVYVACVAESGPHAVMRIIAAP